jgi:hypothetical protein
MCAIVDASVVNDIFSSKPLEAGKEFLKWLNGGSGRLVTGGKLLKEITQPKSAQEWMKQALLSGRVEVEDEQKVIARVTKLRNEGLYKSNDPHVLALAQISGARLLYSNDGDLQQDFINRTLINHPRGKVYTTLKGRQVFGSSHRNLLRRRDLCGPGR